MNTFPIKKNTQGFVSLSFSLWLLLWTSSALGLLSLVHQYRKSVSLQLSLDRCAGQQASKLRNLIRGVEQTNIEMKAIRAAIRLALSTPITAASAVPALEAALVAENLIQKSRKIRWDTLNLEWQSRSTCPMAILVSSHPDFPAVQLPPDTLGPQPWRMENKEHFQLKVQHHPRKSSVHIEKGKNHEWKIYWSLYSRANAT